MRSSHTISAALVLASVAGMIIMTAATAPEDLTSYRWWGILGLLAVVTYAGLDEVLSRTHA